jgi:hypothetical protein
MPRCPTWVRYRGQSRHRKQLQDCCKAGRNTPQKYRRSIFDHRISTDLLGARMPVKATLTSKPVINPLRPSRFDAARLNAAARCAARSKRSGQPCRGPAVRGKRVCRMHGAGGGAPKGQRNGNYRHGGNSSDAIALKRRLNNWASLLKAFDK